jgi:UDP-GlcNAc:undecaprenyl-phosphate GlcNAc-1-phosphate transferase
MFDLSPLTQQHLLLFGTSFILVHLMFSLIIKRPTGYLRQVSGHPSVYYGGAVLIGIISLVAFFSLPSQNLRLGLLAAAFMTLLIGMLDEKYKLSPLAQIFWQFIIATLAVIWGWSISYISHPLEQAVISLDIYHLGPLMLPGSLLTIAWLLLLMNAVNWLDGIDGLALSVSLTALLTLALLALLPSVQDPITLALALTGAGAAMGLLLWNFPPARIYLGTSGSWFLGLYVGIVAILTGGKIVTTLLVLAIPVLDFFFVILQRSFSRQPPWQGDTTRHLHYRLLAYGFTSRQIVIMAIFVSALLGWGALSLQTYQKMITFALSAVMLALLSLKLIWQKKGS